MNRMNASDIVKNLQNQAMYSAYYRPTVFQSTIVSTINTISSTGTPSYSSSLNTVYLYSKTPTYTTYEMMNSVNNGKQFCGGPQPSQMTWINQTSTSIYSYQSIYSSLSTTSTVNTTSTIIQGSSGPVVCSFITYNQGPNFVNTFATSVPNTTC
jgi:hypothetical protein